MDKIFHRADAAQPQAGEPAAQGTDTRNAGPQAGGTAGSPAPASAPPAGDGGNVDVEAVLEARAAHKPGGGGNWRTSIVDLLKLLDLDSSLDARKQLAEELNVHAGADGSAEQNIALSKAVWAELAKNGGQVPASLRD